MASKIGYTKADMDAAVAAAVAQALEAAKPKPKEKHYVFKKSEDFKNGKGEVVKGAGKWTLLETGKGMKPINRSVANWRWILTHADEYLAMIDADEKASK